MDSETLKYKFDGQSHQVEISTFTQVLLSYSTVLQASAREAGIPEGLRISIAATEPGSLDVVLSLAASAADGAFRFVTDYQEALLAAIMISSGLLEFKRKMSGKKETPSIQSENDESVTLSVGGDLIVVDKSVYNVYRNHPEATEAIDHSFVVLEENPAVEGVSIHHGEEPIFSADRDEFSGIASSPNFESESIRHIEEEVSLIVVKPYLSFSKTRKWEFVYAGNKITAPVVDESFLRKLGDVQFSVGTKMRVVLDITQEYSDRYDTYLNKGFIVLRVLDIETPPQTDALDLY